jgi:hypothetical protein
MPPRFVLSVTAATDWEEKSHLMAANTIERESSAANRKIR